MAAEAAFELIEEGRERVLALRGDWTVDTIGAIDQALREVAKQLTPRTQVDVSELGRMDVAGAFVVDRTLLGGGAGAAVPLRLRGQHGTAQGLLEAARKATRPAPPKEEDESSFLAFLERVGKEIANIGEEIIGSLSFLGETLAVIGRLILNPRRMRWVSLVRVMETAGLNALPIIILLNFFVGLVVAYLGARILQDYGAQVFTVQLVAISVMREFAAVITAVVLAGRTNSSFTAEIGAMKMRQEIDAMRVIGIDPMDALVVPRVLAMLVMTPILTFAALMAGIFGGLLVCMYELGISSAMFFGQIAETVPPQHFVVGMVKSPVFAVVLAIIGCRQGLETGGDVASLGQRTTASVVQSIFMVILIDAMFALWFLEMNI